ncbi:MAG: DoxX family protein [Acetobacteraceae bacterium]|nr:DoxX family protein [Acetobacteraceae bacterium]
MQFEAARWQPRILAVLRIVVALLFLQHGLQKVFGFPAPGPAGFAWFSLLGLAAVIEVIGSLLLLVGLFTREAAFIMSGFAAAAYFMVHAASSFYPLVNRGELVMLYCFVFLYFVFAGAGAWSLDSRRPGALPVERPAERRR